MGNCGLGWFGFRFLCLLVVDGLEKKTLSLYRRCIDDIRASSAVLEAERKGNCKIFRPKLIQEFVPGPYLQGQYRRICLLLRFCQKVLLHLLESSKLSCIRFFPTFAFCYDGPGPLCSKSLSGSVEPFHAVRWGCCLLGLQFLMGTTSQTSAGTPLSGRSAALRRTVPSSMLRYDGCP